MADTPPAEPDCPACLATAEALRRVHRGGVQVVTQAHVRAAHLRHRRGHVKTCMARARARVAAAGMLLATREAMW